MRRFIQPSLDLIVRKKCSQNATLSLQPLYHRQSHNSKKVSSHLQHKDDNNKENQLCVGVNLGVPDSSGGFQYAQDISKRVEDAVTTPIRPLSINEILNLHTGTFFDSKDPIVGTHTDTHVDEIVGNQHVSSSKLSPSRQEETAASSSSELYSTLLLSANWARKEVPLRLAHRLHDFNRLPFVVVSNQHVHKVYLLYCNAFKFLTEFGEIETLEDEKRFTANLRKIVEEHGDVVALMQKGISVLKLTHPDIKLDSFLNRLFGTRIGNRVLAETHLALHCNLRGIGAQRNSHSNENVIAGTGVIQHCRPASVIQDVAHKVRQVAMSAYGYAPEVRVEGAKSLTIPYIPDHLRFICFEILKNSIRATIEHHEDKLSMPSVVVGVHKGETQVVIKVVDQGGGLSSNLNEVIWQYGFTTVIPNKQKIAPNNLVDGGATDRRLMAGYGFGLPLSRLYSRYFGGDVDIKFMEGYGTDTYIFLPRLGNQREAEEMLNNILYSTACNKSGAGKLV